MTKVITYGTYDLLHYGHIALLQRAKALGDYLIVGVTSETFDKERGKLNVRQSLAERIEAVRATGIADQIIVEEYEGQKISDIQRYGVDIFTVGSDWVGKFDYLQEYCKVVYLPRTEGVSSSDIRTCSQPELCMGILGANNPAERVVDGCGHVVGLSVKYAYDEDEVKLGQLCVRKHLIPCESRQELYRSVDVVFLAKTMENHKALVMEALENGCHVIYDPPGFLSEADFREVYALADEKKLAVFEGQKTLYFPAFEHLLLLVQSGVLGRVKDISVNCSQIPEDFARRRKNPYAGSMYDWGSSILTPIIKILGCEPVKCDMYSFEEEGFSVLTRGILVYPDATAVFRAGLGIKLEGDLVISGTKGYIYVPAPWWKPDYFEIRYEDLRNTRKYFFKYEGEGFRYMLQEFVRMIHAGLLDNYQLSRNEKLQMTRVLEQFDTGDVTRL